MKLLGEMRKTIDFTLKVYGKDERELPMNHREIFVVPATFVDKKLIFYGRFGTKTIRKYLTSPVAKPTGLSE